MNMVTKKRVASFKAEAAKVRGAVTGKTVESWIKKLAQAAKPKRKRVEYSANAKGGYLSVTWEVKEGEDPKKEIAFAESLVQRVTGKRPSRGGATHHRGGAASDGYSYGLPGMDEFDLFIEVSSSNYGPTLLTISFM